MRSVVISALVAELPAEVVSDAALAAEFGVAEDLVARWSRGRRRHESPDGEGPAALAGRAATRALAARGLEPNDVDFIVFATNTPDMFFPGSACLLQKEAGCRTVGSLDIRSQCTGFLAALDASWRFVATGMFERVLVAAADTPSHFNARDGRTPHLSCSMGDASAVVLLEAGSGPGEVLAVNVHTDGARHTDYWCEYPASRHREGDGWEGRDRMPMSVVEAGLHFPSANLDSMRDLALERLPEVFSSTLARAGVDRVDATLVSHLDVRVEEEIPSRLGDRAGRIETSSLVYAGGASLPVLLAEATADGRLQSGQTVALLAAGSGASWGCGVVRVP